MKKALINGADRNEIFMYLLFVREYMDLIWEQNDWTLDDKNEGEFFDLIHDVMKQLKVHPLMFTVTVDFLRKGFSEMGREEIWGVAGRFASGDLL